MGHMTKLRQRMHMMARLSKGGYLHTYHIVDGETVIGYRSVIAKSRNDQPVTTFALGDQQFATAKEFIAAYEAKKAAA